MLLVYSVMIVVVERGNIKDITDEYTSQIAEDKAYMIEKWLEQRFVDLQTLAMTKEVRSFDQEEYISLLTATVALQNEVYGNIFVADIEGQSFDTLGINNNLSAASFFDAIINQKQKTYMTNASNVERFKQPAFIMAVPIIEEGEIKGLVGATILLKDLSSLVNQMNIRGSGFGWIVDGEGQVIAHKNTQYILNLNVLSADEAGYEDLSRIGLFMVDGSSGSGIYTDEEGFENYLVFRRIEHSPGWTIAISTYANKTFDTVNRLILYMIGISLLVLGVSSYIAYLVAKGITDPIKNLIRVVTLFAKGSTGVRATVETRDEIGMLAEAFNSMANTIIEHTENVEEIIKERTSILADLNYQIVSRNKELDTMNKQLEDTNNSLHQLATTDMLTGIFNRHQLIREIQMTIELSNAGDEQNFSVLFIDLDNFKNYNDTFGHEIGDLLLQEVSTILKSSVRDNDVVGRYGGDEFVVLLKQGNFELSSQIAERIHSKILERKGFKKEIEKTLGSAIELMVKYYLSCSIGIVNYKKSMNVSNADDLLAIADETMYKAKKAGKSRIVVL